MTANPPTVTTVAVAPGSAATAAASRTVQQVAHAKGVSVDGGLSDIEASTRRKALGPNAIATNRASALSVLRRQLRSPLLGLLTAAATMSFAVGQRSDALIIGVILGLSVCLGFGNEYRAERAAASLHSQIHHLALVRRDGRTQRIHVLDLVPRRRRRPARGRCGPL